MIFTLFASFYAKHRRVCGTRRQFQRPDGCVPPSWNIPLGQQFAWQASTRDDAASGVLRPAEEGPGETLSVAEVHLKAGPQEAGGKIGAQGFSGKSVEINVLMAKSGLCC